MVPFKICQMKCVPIGQISHRCMSSVRTVKEIMKIAVAVAGFTPGEADELRGAAFIVVEKRRDGAEVIEENVARIHPGTGDVFGGLLRRFPFPRGRRRTAPKNRRAFDAFPFRVIEGPIRSSGTSVSAASRRLHPLGAGGNGTHNKG